MTNTAKLILLQGHKDSPIINVISEKQNDFEDEIFKHLVNQTAFLEPDVTYTVRMICSECYWNLLNRGQKIEAGKYIYKIVKKKRLPIHFVGKSSSNANLYQLTQPEN